MIQRKPAWVLLFMICSAFICGIVACKPKSKKKTRTVGNVSGDTGDLLDKNSVQFIRTTDRTEGTLNFKTNAAVRCDMEFWNLDTVSAPARADCTQKDVTEVTEKIGPLATDLPYTIKVYLWQGEERRDVRYFQVQEQDEAASFKANGLVVARMVVPQYSTETYRYDLPEPKSIHELRSLLSPSIGCKLGPADFKNPFGEPSTLDIKTLSSDGFAKAPANPNPHDGNRLSQLFEFIQANLNWEWAFVYHDKDFQFTSRPPAYLSQFSLAVGGKSTRLSKEARSLIADSITIPLDSNELELTWQTKNRTSTSHLVVELRKTDNTASLHCFFAAGTEKGSINSDLLASLPGGSYHMTATFESSQIFARKSSDFPTWIISSQDWRYALLSKL